MMQLDHLIDHVTERFIKNVTDSDSDSEFSETKLDLYANQGDAEIFGRICEIAKIHHKIKIFTENTDFHARKTVIKPRIQGLYSQALSEGIMEVLQSYKKTLLEVESLIIGNQNYTIVFVYSYVEKYRGLFNTLNRIISLVKERKLVGCQILSITHQHILNGNEMVHEAIVRIFSNINKVFINQLCSWLLYGELKDPYEEFMICCNKNDEVASSTFMSSPTNADKSLVTTLQDTTLDCGYNINTKMIPYFAPLSLAQEILFIGKTVILFGFDPRKLKHKASLNVQSMLPTVQQYGASDARRFTIWEDNEAEFHEKLQRLKDPEKFEIHTLRTVVREIKECVTKHLWSVAVEEAQLLHELRLMKDFYLLGRGELFLELLRLSAHTLDSPTTRTATRDMNHAFQLAARAVFLSNNADIDKFSFEVPYVKPNVSLNSSIGGDDTSSTVSDGWSNIVLRYNFKWPLHLLFTPEVLARYNDMFRLLLRIKKTQHDLHALWKTYKHSTNFSMCQLHNKLMFLMDNLQHYLQADVLETNFSKFMEVIAKTNDFERLKRAHASFLADVLGQSFLTITSGELECGDTTDSLNNPVFCNIMELLKLCHSFCSMSESVTDKQAEDYYVRGYSERYNKLVKQLMQLLVSVRDRPCGVFLARLLMRLDYNRWLSGEARLTQSVTNMLR